MSGISDPRSDEVIVKAKGETLENAREGMETLLQKADGYHPRDVERGEDA